MAAFPDFSNMNLKDVPGHSSQDWQKLFESAAGAGFDALTGKTMEHIPIKQSMEFRKIKQRLISN